MMIQVLERCFKILEELALDGEVSLENLARYMSMNKGTLCNILKSLITMGYVVKSGRGTYMVSDKFKELCAGLHIPHGVVSLCRAMASELSEELDESIVISTIQNRRVSIISQVQNQRNFQESQLVYYSKLSLYHSVSGRIVLAYLPTSTLKKLFSSCGAPGAEWGGITSFAALQVALGEIRRMKVCIMTNYNNGIKSFAVPIFDAKGAICASLALTMPISHLPSDNGEALIHQLRLKASELRSQIKSNGFDSSMIIHPT